MAKSENKVYWHCANRDCGNKLGTVIRNDLVVILDNVVTVNTNGTALVVTCGECGRAKLWFPDLDSSVTGAARAFVRAVKE